MKKLFYSAICLTLLWMGTSSCRQATETQVINGIVYDASMNNLTVVTNKGDTINVSTMNANPQKVPGVLLNDSVEITCSDTIVDGTKILRADQLIITAHSPYYYIQGTWLEPNPIAPESMQGFTLNQDGTAHSVNMATLLFKSWNLNDKTLTLKYESIGNKLTFESTDTLNILKINTDSLVLERDGRVLWRLGREK